MELLSGFGKSGTKLDLLSKTVTIEDTEFLSKYFVLQEFSPKFTAGKNSIGFNGSDYLKKNSEILVECVDSNGNVLYIESTYKSNISYRESSPHILSIHVYGETSNGPGKLIMVGELNTGETVRWTGNIQIDKTQQNSSIVRFYNKPVLTVLPILTPVLSNVLNLTKTSSLEGSFYSYAANPTKDSIQVNKKNVDVDYRIFSKNTNFSDQEKCFNNQIIGETAELKIKTIQEPGTSKLLNVNITSSYKIKNVLNQSTCLLDEAFSYMDYSKRDVITNIVDGDYKIKYSYITYNTSSDITFLQSTNGVKTVTIKQSFADIIYTNLKTFSGFISRHKLYRKSLFGPGDFEVIADEPLDPYELLKANLTPNKYFDKLGTFFNQSHIDSYWHSSNPNIGLYYSSEKLSGGLKITSSINGQLDLSTLDSLDNYIIVKEKTSKTHNDAEYLPYNEQEFSQTSGSSYDSNFISIKKGVDYIISLNSILYKSDPAFDSSLDIYFTSSLAGINLEKNSVKNRLGLLKLGSIPFSEKSLEKPISDKISMLFSVKTDFYGTIVIVPKKCHAIISNLSLKPYGDLGYSPDVLITRIPFPITIPNETFELKSELFDINSNLIYSDLRTVQSFDPNGESKALFIPGFKDPNTLDFLSGSLEVSQSLYVGENIEANGNLTIKNAVYFPNLVECENPYKRFLAINPANGSVCFTNVNEITHKNQDEIVISMTESDEILPRNYRLIPCVDGRNISILKKSNNYSQS